MSEKISMDYLDRVRRNCRFIIETLGGGKPGENAVFICDSQCRENALALSDMALELGLHPIVIDIDSFGGDRRRGRPRFELRHRQGRGGGSPEETGRTERDAPLRRRPDSQKYCQCRRKRGRHRAFLIRDRSSAQYRVKLQE